MAAKQKTRINEAINEREIRLIDQNGDHIGVMTTRDALTRAQEAGMDLVTVNSTNLPHICRIMDYGQFKYQQAKKRKEARKKASTVSIKEVKMRPKIDEHDYQFKLRNARKFLEAGDKVKMTVMFRGREITHTELGRRLISRMEEDCGDLAGLEGKPSSEGRTIVAVLAPSAARQAARKAEAKAKGEESKSQSPAE